VFCGSSAGSGEGYLAAAAQLGGLLAARGFGLVYGGAKVGSMGALADAVLAAGGEAIGVIPTQLVASEVAHTGVTELHEVSGMHERKARMAALADAFVALPGGIGTMEELFEVWTWRALRLHDKPIGLLDVGGYFGQLARFVDHMEHEGFLTADLRATVAVRADAATLLDVLVGRINYRPPVSPPGACDTDRRTPGR
jgi:uncharacterized protein (TIGR00730 family)